MKVKNCAEDKKFIRESRRNDPLPQCIFTRIDVLLDLRQALEAAYVLTDARILLEDARHRLSESVHAFGDVEVQPAWAARCKKAASAIVQSLQNGFTELRKCWTQGLLLEILLKKLRCAGKPAKFVTLSLSSMPNI